MKSTQVAITDHIRLADKSSIVVWLFPCLFEQYFDDTEGWCVLSAWKVWQSAIAGTRRPAIKSFSDVWLLLFLFEHNVGISKGCTNTEDTHVPHCVT